MSPADCSGLLRQIPEEHRDDIASLIEGALEPYRTILLHFSPRIRILGLRGTLGMRRGQSMSLPIIGLWVDATNMAVVRTPLGMKPVWYAVLFHEIGHAVDYMTRPYRRRALEGAVRSDVRARILSIAEKAGADRTVSELAAGYLMNRRNVTAQGEMKDLTLLIREEFLRQLRDRARPTPYDTCGVSDVYGGETRNRLAASFKHPVIYWSWFMRLIGITPALEYFAENFSDGVMGFTRKLSIQREYLPQAASLLNDEESDGFGRGALWKIADRISAKGR